jgi:hypothetical protein
MTPDRIFRFFPEQPLAFSPAVSRGLFEKAGKYYFSLPVNRGKGIFQQDFTEETLHE